MEKRRKKYEGGEKGKKGRIGKVQNRKRIKYVANIY